MKMLDSEEEEVSAAEIREIFQRFSDDGKWGEFRKRVYSFVQRHYEQNAWLAEELTQETFLRVLNGRRRWRPRKASLFQFICGVAKSIYSHTPENKDLPLEEITEKLRLNKSELALMKEKDDYLYQQFCDKLRDLAKDCPLLSRMTEFYIQDPDSGLKPCHMRALMKDIPRQDVNRIFKRLNELISNLKKELNNG